ncbi:hypothetical protein A4R35_19825 [Thermogemmatispora tikiterensis]|uniref:Uncharacterized protein n=1 Tax=Thermogemmatispora tikiterensis TaxID=1825093 RepID=A0A328VKX4_9CHLR|nr:hypothetical protein A4R35_19825 [Thermogemmatispora tikiterensis]
MSRLRSRWRSSAPGAWREDAYEQEDAEDQCKQATSEADNNGSSAGGEPEHERESNSNDDQAEAGGKAPGGFLPQESLPSGTCAGHPAARKVYQWYHKRSLSGARRSTNMAASMIAESLEAEQWERAALWGLGMGICQGRRGGS